MRPKKHLGSIYHPVEVPLSCNTTLSDFRHHCLPGLNLSNMSTNHITSSLIGKISKLYNEPPISAKNPMPCLIRRQFASPSGNDFALELVREKYFWKRRKEQILDLIGRKYKGKDSLRPDSKKHKKTKHVSKLPYIVTRFADHLSQNPDKSFNGLYNWYFDNALTFIQFSEQSYILHAGGEQLDNLYISSVDLDSTSTSVPVITPKFSIPLEQQNPIFHICSSGMNDHIGIRQRNLCTIFVLDEDSDINNIATKSFSIKSENYPFLSADFATQKICTIDTNRQIKLWSVSRKNCISEASLPSSDLFLSDKFVRIKFSKNYNSIIAIDRKNIYSFDARSSLTVPTGRWSCGNYVEMCENISLMLPSTKESNYYIGTNHSCLLLDSRSGFVKKWSHMLPRTPSIGHVLTPSFGSEGIQEILIFCSQGCNDIVAICNNVSLDFPVTCLPFSLPNRTDTLHDARSHGILYHSVLEDKFDYSVIGLTSCGVSKQPTLFSSISTGDIFQQKFELKNYEPSNQLSGKELSYLENWGNNCIKTFSSRKKFRQVVSHTVGMQDLFSRIGHVEIPEWKAKAVNLGKIQRFTKKELESYSDLLAPYLLNDYGVLNDSDWEDEEDNVINLSSKCIDKVQSWLSTGDNVHSEITDEDDLNEFALDAQNFDSEKDAREIDNTSILSFELSEDEL